MSGSKSKILNNPTKSIYFKKCASESKYDDCLLKIKGRNNYITPIKDEYLKTDNYLQEYNTPQDKFKVRNNLGIEGLAYWGNIQGYLEDQKDVFNYINSEIINGSDKIKYLLKNQDFYLNDRYQQAINELGDIKTIDDAIAVLMYSLFPIEYINWDIACSDISKTYNFEKGTTITLDADDIIGNLTFVGTYGNLRDKASLYIDGVLVKEGQENTFEYSKEITVKDILGENLSETEKVVKSREYSYLIHTNLPFSKDGICKANIIFNPIQYYMYFTNTSELDQNSFSGNQISTKTTNKTHLFTLGNTPQYLYVLSPTKITKVETSAGTTQDSANTFSVSTGWTQRQVQYTPNNGVSQNYWLLNLDTPQCNYVRIRIS